METMLLISYSKPVRKVFQRCFGVGVVKNLTDKGAEIINNKGEVLFIPNFYIGWDDLGKATSDLVVGESVMYGTIPGRKNGMPRASLRIPGNDFWNRPFFANSKSLSNVAGFCIGDLVQGQVRRIWTDKCAISLGPIRTYVWFHRVAKEDLFSRPWVKGQIVTVKIVGFDRQSRKVLAEIPGLGPDPWFNLEGDGSRRTVAGLRKGVVSEGSLVIHSPYLGNKVLMVDVNGIRCVFNKTKKGEQLGDLSYGWVNELHKLSAKIRVLWVDPKFRRVFVELLDISLKEEAGDITLAKYLRSMILRKFGITNRIFSVS